MKGEINRFLDDELGLAELDEETRREAQAWDRLLEAFRVDRTSGAAPPWLEDRIMARIHALPSRGPFRRMMDWLLRPRPVGISPLSAGVVTAGVAVSLLLATLNPGEVSPPGAGQGAGDAQAVTVYVQFSLEAPGAESVAVAGDFSGWSPEFQLSDSDGDGVWTGRVPVRPGVHSYMFVVDGSEWITDPHADRYQDDGFGNQNAVLAVTSSSL